MSDLLELNGLDQSLSVDTEPILERVDEIVQESIERGDVYYALNFGKGLIEVAQISGMGLAKLFYLLKKHWSEFQLGDKFDDVAFAYVGRTKDTVDKYVRVWEMYENNIIPPQFEDEIKQKNIKDQVPIALMTVSQGYELDEEQWQQIVDAPDYTSVGAVVRDIKGKEPRKSALLIFIDSDGNLSAQQEGEIQFVGYFNEEPGDIAEKAQQRLLRSAGVLQR
jgi:hypothetical protein